MCVVNAADLETVTPGNAMCKYADDTYVIGSRALSFSDPHIHFACLSVLLSVRNFGAKYLGNEAR